LFEEKPGEKSSNIQWFLIGNETAALGRNWKSHLVPADWPCRNLVLRKDRAVRHQAADAHAPLIAFGFMKPW